MVIQPFKGIMMKNRKDVHTALRKVITTAQSRLAKGIKLDLCYWVPKNGNGGGLIALRQPLPIAGQPLSIAGYHKVGPICGFHTIDQNFATLAPLLENAPILTV